MVVSARSLVTRILLGCMLVVVATKADDDSQHVCPGGTSFMNFFRSMCEQIYSRDANKDHRVTREEYMKALAIFPYMPQEQKTVHFLVDELNGDGVIDIKDDPIYFRRADTNNDGKIWWSEKEEFWDGLYRDMPFMALFLRLTDKLNVTSLTKDQYQQLFTPLNASVDGCISRAEFRTSWFNELGGVWQDFPKVFPNLDSNNDDTISKSELAQQFAYVDGNNDGKIEYQEVHRIKGPYP